MWHLPILFFFIGFVMFIYFIGRLRGRNYGQKFEEFYLAERQANASRSSDIDEGLFFKPDTSKLPVVEECSNDTLSLRMQRDVLKKAEKKMLKLPAPMTNNDLKLKFGAVNLEIISSYEENFFAYIHALNNWAESLISEGKKGEAEKVLYEGVVSGAETSKTYILLADLYYERNDKQKMAELYVAISGHKMPAQNKAWGHINDYYTKMGLG